MGGVAAKPGRGTDPRRPVPALSSPIGGAVNPGIMSAVGVPALLAAIAFAPIALLRWRWGLYGLLVFLPFAGAVSVTFPLNPWFKLTKDILFVVPVLLFFLLFNLRELRGVRIPAPVLASMLALTAIVLVQTANPAIPNLAVAIVGAKVWLLYLPLVALAAALIRDEADFRRLVRLLTILPLFPIMLGFAQYAQSLTGGYRPTMGLYYGPAAETVTQGFADFNFGGIALFRIPSTFTFHVQYFAFLMASMVPAYAVARADRDKRWRVVGWAMFGLLATASLFSGARSAFILVPAFIVLLLLLEGRGGVLLVVAPVVVVLAAVFAVAAGADLGGLANAIGGRFFHRAGTFEPIIGDLLFGIMNVPFGSGVGMNTDAARFVAGPGSRLILESYYGKTVNELGHIGLVAVILLTVSILAAAFAVMRDLKGTRYGPFAVACVVYAVVVVVNNAKLRAIDLDPTNVLFWVFLGVLFRLPTICANEVCSTGTLKPRPEQSLPRQSIARPSP